MGILPDQMAIITPYQAQVTLLTSLLRPKYGHSLEIGTVDGMQGREKEAVIISLVRSNGDVRVFPSLHSTCLLTLLFPLERGRLSQRKEKT